MLLPQQRTTNALLARETVPKALWVLLALFALVNTVGALRYLLPPLPVPSQLHNFSQRRFALTGHVWGTAASLSDSQISPRQTLTCASI